MNFKTLLHNFTSISTIFPNFGTIHPVVVKEISAGQNLGGKKKKRSKNNKSPILFISLPTSFGRLNEFEPVHEISNNVVCATSKALDQPAHREQSDQSLCKSLEYSMTVKGDSHPDDYYVLYERS